jgi:hypothetical protein
VRPLTQHATLLHRPTARTRTAAALAATALLLAATPATSSARTDARHPEPVTSQFPAFVLDRGRYTSFEAPDPAVGLFPDGITNSGVIVGEYLAPDRESGFIRPRDGSIKRLDLPRAAATQVDTINDRGQIVGNYSTVSTGLPDETSRGYILELRRGKITRLDMPGAVATIPHGINDRGDVVGAWLDDDLTVHGFLWSHGRYRVLDFPGAAETEPYSINDKGQVTGNYYDDDGTTHGFVLTREGFRTFDIPDAPTTVLGGINDLGQIVGFTTAPTPEDPLAGARAFLLRRGIDGPVTDITPPGAPRALATAIDDRGRVVGVYENPDFQPGAVPDGEEAGARALASPTGTSVRLPYVRFPSLHVPADR